MLLCYTFCAEHDCFVQGMSTCEYIPSEINKKTQIFSFPMCVQTSTHITRNILTNGKCTHFVSFSKYNPLIYYFV